MQRLKRSLRLGRELPERDPSDDKPGLEGLLSSRGRTQTRYISESVPQQSLSRSAQRDSFLCSTARTPAPATPPPVASLRCPMRRPPDPALRRCPPPGRGS